MNLYNVNKQLAESVQELCEGLAIGQTVDDGIMRIVRANTFIRVYDMTNAGKRGKKVDTFVLYDLDYVRNPQIKKLVEQFAAMLPRIRNYRKALAMANGVVSESQRILKNMKTLTGAGSAPKMQIGQERGVDVALPGQKEIQINGAHVTFRAHPTRGFSITDTDDQNNLPTIMTPVRGGKRKANQAVYKMGSEDKQLIARATLSQIRKRLDLLRVGYHQFMAMD
jgi:hypothetical protein